MNLLWVAILAGVLLFLALFVASFALIRRRGGQNRIAEYAAQDKGATTWRSYFGRAETLLKSLGEVIPRSPDDLSRQGRRLVQAGIRRRDGAVLLVGVQGAVALFFLLVFSLAGLLVDKPILYIILSILIGALIPDIWLGQAIKARKERIQHGLPDALDLTVVCVEAGLGLDQALMRIGQELKHSRSDLSEELGLLTLEVNAGKTRADALRNLAKRTDVEDLKALVAILIQTDRFGTSIGQSLRVFAQNLRIKRRQRAEEKAGKIPVKMIPAMVLFVFPAVFVVVAGPAVIKLVKELLPFLGGS